MSGTSDRPDAKAAPVCDKTVAVLGWSIFAPGYRPAAADAQPAGELIDKRARRRTSAFTRALADVYAATADAAQVEVETVATVFGSALGEAETMISLLDQMFGDAQKPPSPMRFAMSVHNAAAGVVSTATQNRGFYTSLGADFDTPAMALFEAIGLVIAEQRPVIVVCGDEGAPNDLVNKEGHGWQLLTAAIALGPEDAGADRARPCPVKARLRGPFMPHEQQVSHMATADVSPAIGRNPQAGLLDLLWAIEEQRTGSIRLDRGFGRGFAVEITAAD